VPFNLLLLPLLGGYLYLSKSNVRSYWTAQLQKEQLLFSAATYGLLFLLVSRLVVLWLLSTDEGLELAQSFHKLAPFPFAGTAFGTILLAVVAWVFSNMFVNEETAGHWLYHRGSFDPLTDLFWQSAIGSKKRSAPTGFLFIWKLALKVSLLWIKGLVRLAAKPRRWSRRRTWQEPYRLFLAARAAGLELAGFPLGSPTPVMLSMKDSKVIVAIVVELSALKPNPAFVTVLPLWTGYRESTTRRVYKTVNYEPVLQAADDPLDFSRVIRTADIATATIWDEAAFVIPESADSSAAAEEPAQR